MPRGPKPAASEIAEQLGWRTPQHVVCPMAGGSLVVRLEAFQELAKLGLIGDPSCKITAPTGRLQSDSATR